jgi:hypothetical protein
LGFGTNGTYLFMDIDAVPLDTFLELCTPHTFMISICHCKAISQRWVRTDHTRPKRGESTGYMYFVSIATMTAATAFVLSVLLSGLVALWERDMNTYCLRYTTLYVGADYLVSPMASRSLRQRYTVSILSMEATATNASK